MSPARRVPLCAVAALAVAASCKKEEPKDPPAPATSSAKATSAARDTCLEPDHATGALRWIEDDLAAALGCAGQKTLPVVVDLWAPWCHTCLSMQQFVFPDPALAPLADRFVFAALDTDREVNAAAVEKYPLSAWPTFYVLGPDGEVHGRFVGAASVEQFRDFLVESERAYLAGAELPPDSPLAHLVAADRQVARALALPKEDPARAEALAEAEAGYRKALAAAPADWPRRPDVLVSLIGAIARRGDHAACLDLALAEMDRTGSAASATDFVVVARGCANGIELADPTRPDAFRARAATRLEALLADPAASMSADDRSDAMMNLRELYDDLARPTDALAMAEAQAKLLDEAVAKAPSPMAAMTYAWPRTEVYAYLRRHDELVPWLEELSAKLPQEYDPPYRLAWLYKDAGQPDKALPWAKKAEALAYGPRLERIRAMIGELTAAAGSN